MKNQYVYPQGETGHTYEGDPDGSFEISGGLTLRQYYAAKAMQGELAAQSKEIGQWTADLFPDLAIHCFQLADAMIAAEEK